MQALNAKNMEGIAPAMPSYSSEGQEVFPPFFSRISRFYLPAPVLTNQILEEMEGFFLDLGPLMLA